VTPLDTLAVGCAAVGAGIINTVVGSGTLITFPTLLAIGCPPVTANVSNTLGLVAGGLTGTWGYRRELAGQGGLLLRLAPATLVGAVAGAVLLLLLPSAAFAAIVPVLILGSLVLVVLQPRLAERTERARAALPAGARDHRRTLLLAGILATGVYGGYFGAAQGVMLVGLLGSLLAEGLQHLNGIKNVLATLANVVAAVTFLVVSPHLIDGVVVVTLAAGSLVGGLLGAAIGRRLPAPVLRGVIVTVGLVAVAGMVAG